MKSILPFLFLNFLWLASHSQAKLVVTIDKDEKISVSLNDNIVNQANGIQIQPQLLGSNNSIIVINQSNANYHFAIFNDNSITAVINLPIKKISQETISFDLAGNCIGGACNGPIGQKLSLSLINDDNKINATRIQVNTGISAENQKFQTVSANGTLQKIVYYDAISLAQYSRASSVDPITVTTILQYYNHQGTSSDPDVIKAAYKDNPFLKDIVISLFNKRHGPTDKDARISFPQNLLTSAGGIGVTNFADGVAKFLVKRFKEELSITFFTRFKQTIDNNAVLKTLFPETVKVLGAIDKDIFHFSVYLNTLREAFIKDLTNLYANLKKAKDLDIIKNVFTKFPEIETVVTNAFYFIDQFASGFNPGQVIANYDPDASLKFSDPALSLNLRSSVKVLQIFSESFRSLNTGNYWVPADSVVRFFADSLQRNIYFGLIYQALDDTVKFRLKGSDLTFAKVLEKAKDEGNKLTPIIDLLKKIINHAQEVNEYIASISQKKKSEIDYNDYYKLYNAALDILNDGVLILDIPQLTIDPTVKANIENQAARWIGTARNAGELYVDIRTKNYSSAIINLASIIDSIFVNGGGADLRNTIINIGTFIATVAQAQNSDDVEAAIEALALPSGSARIKRESVFNISLNAYAGVFAGQEIMPTLKVNQTAWTTGITAPVGIAFSFGNIKYSSKTDEGGKSISIFVPLIDVGALAAFRINDDSSKVSSNIELKNIFSPGVFLYYGFGKYPISVGFGAQVGPQLRDVTAKDININKNFYVRWGLTVAVDIPVLNFYTKPRNKGL